MEVLIEDLKVCDRVMSFDPGTELGQGHLVAKEVTSFFQNTTSLWLKLNWRDSGESHELITTPSHHYLREDGQFGPISEIVNEGTAKVFLKSGEVVTCQVEYIIYSAETAERFEQVNRYGTVDASALAFETFDERVS